MAWSTLASPRPVPYSTPDATPPVAAAPVAPVAPVYDTPALKAARDSYIAAGTVDPSWIPIAQSDPQKFDQMFAGWWSTNMAGYDPKDHPEDAALLSALGVPNTHAIANQPDLLKAYTDAYHANPKLDVSNFLISYEGQHPDDARFQDPKFLSAAGIEANTQPQLPVEQQLANYVTNLGQVDIANDANRQNYANDLLSKYQPIADSNMATIGSLASPGADVSAFLAKNPGAYTAFDAMKRAGTFTGTLADFVPQYAKQNNLPVPMVNDAALTTQLNASNTAKTTQLDALQGQLDTLSTSLQGELGKKASDLAQMISSLKSANSNYTDAQKATLATQVQQQFATLDAQVQAQKQNLSASLATMGSGISAADAAKRADLQSQLSTMGNAITAADIAKKQNIQAQLATMDAAIGTNDTAQKQALQTQLDQLNAAEVPLQAARITAAQTDAASINLAGQSQADQIRADSASAGYAGTSSGEEMALARAAIGARQTAASHLGDAKVMNAQETAGIAQGGANSLADISKTTAGAKQSLANFGAGEFRGLGDTTAGAVQNLANFGAGESRTIGDTTAGQNQQLTNYGATESRTLGDTAATGKTAIANFGTNQGATIDNTSAGNLLAINQADAGQTQALGDFGATQEAANKAYGAQTDFNVKSQAAQNDLGFFSQDLQNRLNNLNTGASQVQTNLQLASAGDAFGQSGLNRTMQNLNFFNTNSTSAPTVNPFVTTPINSGLENLGAGLLSTAGNIANANNYWASPAAKPPSTAATVNPGNGTFNAANPGATSFNTTLTPTTLSAFDTAP